MRVCVCVWGVCRNVLWASLAGEDVREKKTQEDLSGQKEQVVQRYLEAEPRLMCNSFI